MSVDYIIKEFETQGYDKDNLKKVNCIYLIKLWIPVYAYM